MVRQVGWLVLTAAVMLPGCGKPKKYEPGSLGLGNTVSCSQSPFSSISGDIPRLQLVSTCSRFAGYLAASLSQSGNSNLPTDPGDGSIARDLGEVTADADGGAPVSFSKTNVQEAGVDEPDIVKTDGKFLYVLSGNELVVLKSWPPTELSTVSKLAIADWPHALVLEGDHVAVISSLGYDYEQAHQTDDRPFVPTTRITVVDVTDRAQPKVDRTIDLEVWYQDARLIDGKLVVVGESSLPMPALDLTGDEEGGSEPGGTGGGDIIEPVAPKSLDADRNARIADAVAETRFEDWIPSLDDSVAPGRRLVITSFDDLYMPTVVGQLGMLSLVTLDLAHPSAPLGSTALVSRGGMVYASANALFVSYTSSQWLWLAADTRVSGDVAVSPWSGGQETSMQKFALKSGHPKYAGAATVPGWVSSPFQLSEHEGYLRVVSSSFDSNMLTVLGPKENGDMVAVGAIPSFAPDETVMGSRFFGDRAYVSTYHMVLRFDPFFTFDLSDPVNPVLVGALEMPGYSAFLQPLDEQYVLALGMFAANMGDPVTAVQVQVFDVSDFAHPVTHAQYVIETGIATGGRSFSEALGAHHAFTWYPEEKIFAFPVSVWHRDWTEAFNGLMAFRVDTAAGISKLGEVDHRAFYRDVDGWYDSDVRRSVFMTGGDGATYAYSISNRGVLVNDVAAFGTILDAERLPFNEIAMKEGMPGDVRIMRR